LPNPFGAARFLGQALGLQLLCENQPVATINVPWDDLPSGKAERDDESTEEEIAVHS